MRKTKIICSIGFSNSSSSIIKDMLDSGMNVARFDLGSSSYDFVESEIILIRRLSRELGKPCGIMLDTTGPEYRINDLSTESLLLSVGEEVYIYNDGRDSSYNSFSIASTTLISDISVGMRLLLSDSKVILEVTNKTMDTITCKVIDGGYIYSKDVVHIPNLDYRTDFLTKKDIEDINFAHKVGADFLALSYVKNHMDVLDVTDKLIEINDDHIEIIAKIENALALEDINKIVDIADGIMISRGDLGLEINIAKLPGIQKKLTSLAREKSKVSIISTDLLSSMKESLTPSRAEVSDIYNVTMDLADAVSLYDETIIGNNPVESVKMMDSILDTAEKDVDYLDALYKSSDIDLYDIPSSIAHSVVDICDRLEVQGIFTSTLSGYTAKKISSFRPKSAIIATIPDMDALQLLTIRYGIYPVLINKVETTTDIIEVAKDTAIEVLKLKPKDLIIITGSLPATENTNFLKVEEL